MAVLALDRNEFCPSCGEWVEELVEGYGWCSECVFGHQPPSPTYISKDRTEQFLSTHADRIEILMYEGLTLTAAMKAVRDEIRPKCLVCNKDLNYGKSFARFCRTHRHYADRLYKLRRKGYSTSEALERILNA